MNSGLSKLPENMNFPALRKLFLQDNYDLSEIPLSFFEFMPALQVLDMSRTNIKYLPPSISNLAELQKLSLRGCKLLMELPPEIRALKNLVVFDLAGTELIYIPKEIEMLSELEHLEVSLCACADEYISEIKENGEIIPRKTLSKLLNLKKVSIFVDPDCEWWYAEVEAVIQDLFSLKKLETVKLYFPTIELLQKFLQLPRVESQSLSNFRLLVGRHDQGIISRVPPDLQDRFEILEKCLKYVNGEGNIDGIGQALKQARALFLDRHWTIDRLSTFKAGEMDRLRFCLLVECNEMITVIDGGDSVDKSNGGKPIFGLLQYLSIHYMKNLESILVGPLASGCLYNLHILALHTCPKLTTIFNAGLLSNLVNLKELIVEDCPKVESLVTVESSHLESGKKFLPSLEKISLLHLPGLVSIYNGLCVAPRLQKIVVYNCPKLQSLSPAEMSSIDIEEIKGESEWWEALEWKSNQPEYLRRVFVPLRRDGLMNQLAEARNSHNTLSMIQNSSKNQKASNSRSGAKRKPNDPKANSSSPHSEEPKGRKAPEVVVSSEHEQHRGVGPGSSKSESETPKGPNTLKSRHERRPSQEQDDLRRATDSPLRQDAVGQKATVDSPPLLARGISTVDRSIERSPLHPNYHAKVVNKSGGVSSPSWERKGSAEGSHGVAPTIPGRSQSRPATHGDENRTTQILEQTIGSTGLSLRMALHTCPKLTTIVNVGLLSNLVNLKELIVEDCPKVESLVTVESSHLESGKKFLPSLEKISLLHLPGLVSISSGLCVTPRLQRVVVYNCPKLQSLSPTEMFSIGIEEIKGESEWWKALEWKSNQPDYLHRVFVPLRIDGLMNQLAEARNTHNTLSMIQNTNKNQERSEAPKLGNWESCEVPHADYFKKASDIQESELPVARTIPERSRFRSRLSTYDDENLAGSEVTVPKFGDWAENDPTSAEGFTQVFKLVRDERNSAGKELNRVRKKEKWFRKGGCFFCLGGRK